jgi:hypothetical protein
MSILAEQAEHRAIETIVRALKILEAMPSNLRISKEDDFE